MVNKKNIVMLLCAFCALCLWMLCGCGKKDDVLLIGSVSGEKSSGETAYAAEDEHGREQEEDTGKMIRVYVCGAVANPGVVEIPEDSRAEDALMAAGGFGGEAARDAVNLADWVSDGQKLYFPAEDEAEELKAREADAAAGVVNINTADMATLCTLPGVGESRAADIIAYREANGGFESCEDIMKVSGIKNSLYEKIRDRIRVK